MLIKENVEKNVFGLSLSFGNMETCCGELLMLFFEAYLGNASWQPL